MKYRLKDRELQKKLDEISDGSFSSRLADVSGEIPNLFRQSISTRIYFGDKYQFSLHATQDMLEEVPEYDPHGWNIFPEVEPPEGVLMRVECRDGRKACAKYRLFIEGGSWCDVNGGAWPEAYSQSVARFRPWNEEDKE